MHVKSKHINAVHNAIDFISTNVDGADEGNRQEDTLDALRELRKLMVNSQHRRRVNYYIKKSLKKSNQ